MNSTPTCDDLGACRSSTPMVELKVEVVLIPAALDAALHVGSALR